MLEHLKLNGGLDLFISTKPGFGINKNALCGSETNSHNLQDVIKKKIIYN